MKVVTSKFHLKDDKKKRKRKRKNQQRFREEDDDHELLTIIISLLDDRIWILTKDLFKLYAFSWICHCPYLKI